MGMVVRVFSFMVVDMDGLIRPVGVGMGVDMGMLMGVYQFPVGMLMGVGMGMLMSMLERDGIFDHQHRGRHHDG